VILVALKALFGKCNTSEAAMNVAYKELLTVVLEYLVHAHFLGGQCSLYNHMQCTIEPVQSNQPMCSVLL